MRLKDYLEKNEITQGNFANVLGISRRTLNFYVNFKYQVPYSVKLAIEHLTEGKVTVDDWAISQVPRKKNRL